MGLPYPFRHPPVQWLNSLRHAVLCPAVRISLPSRVALAEGPLPVTVFVPVLRQTRAAPAPVRFRSNDPPAAHNSPSYSATALSATAGFLSTGHPSVWRVLRCVVFV